ncbi:putative disease resistance protein [Sesamum alatum]|uniref:Disease resistance protein n=1 Tax=Sesamum alatum TaxID=300844 RepID=A0AAE2CMK9_9LAMI|nr:putative disease resistance protein [Sesamum alatum]
MYLKALVDRNLIFVSQRGTNGNVKSYSIHDLLRDLCVRKAREEKFLFIYSQADDDLRRSISSFCRLCYHGPFSIVDSSTSMEQIRLARSLLLFNGIEKQVRPPMFSELRLLRVLDISSQSSWQLEEILQLVNLRYLALTVYQSLPSSISRLCNLQTLFARHGGSSFYYGNNLFVIPGILDMPELRHIKFKGRRTYVEYHGEDKNRFVVLDKLQTLSPIAISQLTDKVLETLPNLEELGILWDKEVDHVIDLSRLHKLHTLKCTTFKYDRRGNLLSNLIFPPSLNKLTLGRFAIMDHHMNEIGKLPNLQTLKLRRCFFRSGKWEVEDGEFCRLQFLLMEDLSLVNWAADDTHFPRLEHLVIRLCDRLKEIPLAIGDIPTLKVIEVYKCSPSVAASARGIQEAQLDIGNEDLQVRILEENK